MSHGWRKSGRALRDKRVALPPPVGTGGSAVPAGCLRQQEILRGRFPTPGKPRVVSPQEFSEDGGGSPAWRFAERSAETEVLDLGREQVAVLSRQFGHRLEMLAELLEAI